ncbi:MAG: DUF192 domain-containing protein [Candidatus Saccharimonadales bacterium]
MSLRHDGTSWALIVLLLVIVAGATIYILWPQLQPHTTLRLGDGVFTANIITTPEASGASSGTRDLQLNQATLFVYASDAKWSVNMKDYASPLDIVWLDKDKQVVYIVKNVMVNDMNTRTFVPNENARYIVELPVGTVTQKAINIGSSAVFDEHVIKGSDS